MEPGPGATTAELTYVVRAEPDEVDNGDGSPYFERLSAWQDGLSLPRAVELTDVGVRTDEDSGTVFARYLLSADDEAEAVAIVARAAASGDYELLGASTDEPPTTGPLRLVDDDGRIVVVEIVAASEDETFAIEAAYGFTLEPID